MKVMPLMKVGPPTSINQSSCKVQAARTIVGEYVVMSGGNWIVARILGLL
jgi:hypothetical protein